MTATAPKRRVALIFGGTSVEHEVSINSARNVVAAIDTTQFEVTLIGIDPQGLWHHCTRAQLLSGDKKLLSGPIVPGDPIPYSHTGSTRRFDVVFPVLHGTGGEDGSLQGMLTLAGVPFVGPDVLGSAIAMDKDVTKRLWQAADLPVAPFRAFKAHERSTITFASMRKELGLPFFVKPARLGSSVGVSKVHNEAELVKALDAVFTFDSKVLIEQYIEGQEVECAVLGNEEPRVSEPGSIVPTAEFYSYDAKYTDANGATMAIPAPLTAATTQKIKEMAITAFTSVECEGLSRVDFFVTKDERIYLNEINTIPGFTSISMYPKLWEHSGLSYTDLITALIELAIARGERQAKLVRQIV